MTSVSWTGKQSVSTLHYVLYTLHRDREPPLISIVSIPIPVPVPFPCSVYERSVIKHHREIADIVQKGNDLNFRTQYMNILFSLVISVASNVQILWTSTRKPHPEDSCHFPKYSSGFQYGSAILHPGLFQLWSKSSADELDIQQVLIYCISSQLIRYWDVLF